MGPKKTGYILMAILIAGILIVAFFVKKKSAAEKNREELALLAGTLSADANSYFQSHNSFAGWKIPDFMQVDKIGKMIERADEKQIKIVALGTEIGKNGISQVKVEYIITNGNSDLIFRN